MNDDYSYVGVPATTQEVIVKEDYEHPVSEASETSTLAGPEAPAAPKQSDPTLAWKSLITPIGTLVLGAVLALGHHTFNSRREGKPAENGVVVLYMHMYIISQHLVTLVGVVFSFGFKSAIGVTMGFVRLQCLWLSAVRQPLTIQQINTMYQIERQDQLYKTLPQALFFSPTIVVFSVLTLLLPLSGIFAPGSLIVSSANTIAPCTIPTGNLSNFNQTPISFPSQLTEKCFVEQNIPELPQACGPNCYYEVQVPSFAFNCTPTPSSLPDGQAGDVPFWNGTMYPNSTQPLGIHIAWNSNGPRGTSGSATCSLVEVVYSIEVTTKGGVQSVMPRVIQIISPSWNLFTSFNLWEERIGQISLATMAVLRANDWSAVPPSFLEVQGVQGAEVYIWGDVLEGIKEMAHNVTAALLTLPLGNMRSECSYELAVYQYSPLALWVPYGTAVGIALISLIVSVMIMARYKTGHITTSFSDAAILLRNVGRDVAPEAKLTLGVGEDGKFEYTIEYTDGTSEYGGGKVDGLLKSIS